VRQGGELLGVLRIKEREGEPLTPVEERLFAGLAGQAGLVLRGVRLRAELAERVAELTTRADELAASRRRLVDIQDAERRRLERDIHDGAQQHLVALSVNLRLAQQLLDRSPDRARLVLAEQADAARETIHTLTNLSLGIYPSRLGTKGIAAALEAAVATSAVQVEISAAVNRYEPDIEAAIYFICLEAIQNAAKHADAEHVDVSICERDRVLVMEITDDGVGFVPDDLVEGEGIANMRVRAETVGGGLEVGSSRGTGTTVRAWVPLQPTPPPAEWTP
jgi:signal transduction histidine kinase